MAHKRITILYGQYCTRLFYNPVSYMLGIFFVIYCSVSFFAGQRFFAGACSADMHHFFSGIPSVMVLTVPAFAAILPSVKKELLLPLKDTHVIAAKVFAVFSATVVCTVLTVPVLLCVNTFGDIDISQASCGYSVILLHALAFSSCCIFFFTILCRKVAAFTACILFSLIINSSHLVSSYVSLPDFISGFFKMLSFAWHFDSASKGIIDSRDILFYISSCSIFIFASCLSMEIRRDNRNLPVKKFSILALSAFFLIQEDSSRFFLRIDTSREKKFSISQYSSVLLSQVKEPLQITYYRSSVLKNLYPQVRDVDDFIQAYAGESPNVFYQIIDPAKKHIEKTLENNGIRGERIQTADDSTTSYTTVYSAVSLNYLGRTEIIPFVLDSSTLEYDLTGRIQSLVRGIERNVQLVCGNGLSPDVDYGYVQAWLESQGFTVTKPALSGLYTDIPLVLLGTSECTWEDADAISYFIQRGGKAFIATTPYRIDLKNNWSVQEKDSQAFDNVVYMLQQYGLYFKDTVTADSNSATLTLADKDQKVVTISYPLWPVLKKQDRAKNGMTLFWPCAIDMDFQVASDSGFDLFSILHTSADAWQVKRAGESFITNPFSVEKSASLDEEKGQFTLCVELKKNGRTHCIVLGDQYAMNTDIMSLGKMPDTNLVFLVDSLLRLCGQEALGELRNKSLSNSSLYKENPMSAFSVWCCTVFIPAALLFIVFIVTYIKRRSFNREASE